MSSTASTVAPVVDTPLVVARSKANLLLLVACVVCLFLFGSISLAAFSVMTILQVLRTFVLRTIFYESHLEHRAVFGRTIRADYSQVAVLSSWPEALMLVGEDRNGKCFEIYIGGIDGDTSAVRNFLKPRIP